MKRTTQRTELRTVRSTSNRAPASSKASLQFYALASSRNRTNSLHSRLFHRQRLHSDIEANKTYPYAMANTQRSCRTTYSFLLSNVDYSDPYSHSTIRIGMKYRATKKFGIANDAEFRTAYALATPTPTSLGRRWRVGRNRRYAR